MENECYDEILCDFWNKKVSDVQLCQEQFWDICRIFEESGYLVKNKTAVSTFSIGPFRIATNLSFEKKDMLIFFAETVVPLLITESPMSSLEDKWQFIFLPLTHICIELLDKTCKIKDILSWKILLYIKNMNDNNYYPTLSKIISEFPEEEHDKIDAAVKELVSYTNILGDNPVALIQKMNNGYKSLV